MTLSIFNDIWKFLTDVTDNIYDFIMNNYSEPFFWIILFGVLLLITAYGISNLANK